MIEQPGRPLHPALCQQPGPPAAIFSDRTRFPCAFSAAGETRRETLLRKAPESTAHVAGFGFHSEGCGPPNLPEGFFDSLIFSFGPALVMDGEVSVADGDEVARSMTSNPRTAIGQIGSLHYAFVVTDGRTEESAGLSLVQLADLMLDIGCETAYNLDGGGSSTMVFQGEVVNNPTTNGRTITEREVSDIVYIGL